MMSCLWPATLRTSSLSSRSIFQKCHEVDSFATRLAQPPIRPYSIASLPFRRREYLTVAPGLWRQRQSTSWSNFPNSFRGFASKRVLKSFSQLPKDYKDESGLDFREKPLAQTEAQTIFGKAVDVHEANRLLKVLHGRRVAGTLEDPIARPGTQREAHVQQLGLDWLRKNVPTNEIENAGQRAEQELADMESDLISKSEKMGLYKPNSGTIPAGDRNAMYGPSALDAIRKAKEQKLDEKEAEEKRIQEETGQHKSGTLQHTGRSTAVLERAKQSPRLKYYLERAKILPNTPPEMSKLQRLGPSGIVALATCLGCLLFASVYTPPKQTDRLWPDVPRSAATIISIIAINVGILALWRFPPAFRMLNKYFITVPGYPYPLSLIGNIFSHQTVSHFAVNMATLWFVGTRLHEEVGRGNFLAIYVASGVIGSYISLIPWVLKNKFVSSSLGASGAIYGLVSCYLWLNSGERMTIFGVFPPENWPSLSAMTVLMVLGGYEIWSIVSPRVKLIQVDNWAHLGGMGGGIIGAELLNSRIRRKRELEIERRKNLGIVDRIKEGRL